MDLLLRQIIKFDSYCTRANKSEMLNLEQRTYNVFIKEIGWIVVHME